MNNFELLKVEVNDKQEQVISGRMLHEFLQIGTRYDTWFSRMLNYGFSENNDFVAIAQKRATAQGNETTYTDHILKLNMAKELCMLARNERGKEARKYFIKCEEAWNSPDMIMSRALQIMQNKLSDTTRQLQMANQFIEEAKPKLTYYDTILNSKGTMSATQIGADYGLSAIKLNQILRDWRLIRKVGGQYVLYAEFQNQGLTESKTHEVQQQGAVRAYVQTRWTQKGRLKIHEILTSLGYVANYDRTESERLFA